MRLLVYCLRFLRGSTFLGTHNRTQSVTGQSGSIASCQPEPCLSLGEAHATPPPKTNPASDVRQLLIWNPGTKKIKKKQQKRGKRQKRNHTRDCDAAQTPLRGAINQALTLFRSFHRPDTLDARPGPRPGSFRSCHRPDTLNARPGPRPLPGSHPLGAFERLRSWVLLVACLRFFR